MFNKVLFPVIITEHTEQIVNCLSGLSKNGVKEVLLFHVLSLSELASGRVSHEQDEIILKRWVNMLMESGMKADYKIVSGVPWVEIIDRAEKENYSFIMIGSHGSTFLDRVLLGSVTQNVVHHSQKPIFIFKIQNEAEKEAAPYCLDAFRKIIYATDFSDASIRCIPYIEQMLIDRYQELEIIHIQDLRHLKYVTEEQLEDFDKTDAIRLQEVKEHFEKVGFKRVKTILKTGYSIPEILNQIQVSAATLVVLGKKGRSNIQEMLLGGVAETIIYRSPVPLFIVESKS